MYPGIAYETALAFPDIHIPDVNRYYENIISCCADIFGGNPPWKTVKRSGLYGKGERDLAMMNTAKVLCDFMADLTFGRQADIIIDSPHEQNFIDSVLQNNAFWEKMPQNFSLGYALGGAVVKVFINNGEICLDYVSAENFLPLKWNSRQITEGIFRTKFCAGNAFCTLFEKHGFSPEGLTQVEYKLFSSGSFAELGSEIPIEFLFPDMKSRIVYPFKTQMFSYFHPASSNNILTDGSLGMSVFYPFKDTLKALDIAFDSFMREFILGRKRIIVPSSCIRTVVDPDTGSVKRYFDADDEVYQALSCDDEKDLKIIDNTAELRVEEHVNAINSLINVLCFQTGLSSGTLSFTGTSNLRTAAEINSQESRTARTMNSNRNIAAEYLEGIVRAVLAAGNFLGRVDDPAPDIRVIFSKETDISVDKEIERNIRLADLGYIDKNKAKENIADIL